MSPNQHEEELVDTGAIPPDDFHNSIERIKEVADYDLEIDTDLLTKLEAATEGLLVSKSKLHEIVAGLIVGHVVLQGPPGTGKSSLARAIAKAFNISLMPTTAHEEWSTFEVIGRQTIEIQDGKEAVVPVNGVFTEAVIRCAGTVSKHFDRPEEPQATWLLIDELNRAHADRAFGELFSALGSNEPVAITLGFQKTDNQELVTPRRFRIIGTINSFDKQFVNGLSQALRRRFTFITIDVPEKRSANEAWVPVTASSSQAVREFAVVAKAAFARVERREQSPPEEVEALRDELTTKADGLLADLFELIEKVRYAGEGGEMPHLPIGTAQLIDTVELFITKALLEKTPFDKLSSALDWAASVKLAPLFEADSVNPKSLKHLEKVLPPAFRPLFSRALLETAAAGLYHVG
jgi:5-methylcytosine-specific restriction protein B